MCSWFLLSVQQSYTNLLDFKVWLTLCQPTLKILRRSKPNQSRSLQSLLRRSLKRSQISEAVLKWVARHPLLLALFQTHWNCNFSTTRIRSLASAGWTTAYFATVSTRPTRKMLARLSQRPSFWKTKIEYLKKEGDQPVEGEVPTGFTISLFHICFMYSTNITVVSKISRQIVYSQNFKDEKLLRGI